jgi:thioredoxin-like negative regulator of GroEL
MPYQTISDIYANKITVVSNPQVTLTLTADDWELYSDYDDTGRYAARENVAVALNERIANAINTSQNRDEAYRRCVSILERYSDTGAADTEGREVLYDIFELAYGNGG